MKLLKLFILSHTIAIIIISTSFGRLVLESSGNIPYSSNSVSSSGTNEFQAEKGILISAYVLSQYGGYTGTGYVDLADKIGAAVEISFRRASSATDTVRVYFANGGSSRALSVTLNDVPVGSLTFPPTGSWSTWSSVTILVGLQSGLNRLRFSSTTNASNPNIDRIVISGQQATPVYKLTLLASGPGTVSANPPSSDTYYDSGVSVTLSAYPSGGNVFYRWSGTIGSRDNPLVITMNSHMTEVAVMASASGFGQMTYESRPRGFASVGALGCPNGTTGGSGPNSSVVYVTNSDTLYRIMVRRVDTNRTLNFPPLNVYIVGTLTPGTTFSKMLDVKDVYDISIIGVGVDATISGFGLNITRASNIIVRNIKFQNGSDDGINISAEGDPQKGHHIWIDHCSFTNCYDGAIDVTHASAYVTISWNHFFNHDKTSLSGNSDNTFYDTLMKVTYHHNYFDGTVQRHPRVRFGKVHVFNNYFRQNSLYGVSSNREADVVVEGNYFFNVPIPYETLRVGTNYPGDLVARYNILAGTTGPGSTRGSAFNPSAFYQYTLDSASQIPQLVSSYAGSGKYDFSGGEEGYLPIQLASFTGEFISHNTVKLQWETISEVNNLGFYVEKYSNTVQEYLTISDLIEGAGTTLEPQTYSWIDENAIESPLIYRLKQVNLNGSVNYYGPITLYPTNVVQSDELPSEFVLYNNYPNPFNPSTSIRVGIPAQSYVTLTIYNVLGQKVTELVSGKFDAGYYTFNWNGKTNVGEQLSSGIYFYKMEAISIRDNKSFTDMRKMILVK